ncbi:MAG: DUF4249 domain-containing protein [Hymenobacter sp.]|nr:DUF4249 domain-containing protein [Hymenobacter sp.]
MRPSRFRSPYFHFLLALATGLSLSACEEVVDVTIPAGPPLLVVDGAVTDHPGPNVVKLSQTVPYFTEQALPPVSGAVLTLSDNEGRRETLREQVPGTYVTSTFRGRIGNQYTLSIQTGGEEYRAETEIRRTPPLDSVRVPYRANPAVGSPGYYTLYYGPEPAGLGDYYRFKVFRNGRLLNRPEHLLVRSDELVDGRYIGAFELTNNNTAEEEFQRGDRIRVEMNSLPRDYFFFLNEFVLQRNNFGLFAQPRANLRTNVRNVNPQSALPAVGYFAGYTVRQDSAVTR